MIPKSAEVRSPAPSVDLSLHPPDCDCEDCTADFHARKPATPSLREALERIVEQDKAYWCPADYEYMQRQIAALASSDPGSPRPGPEHIEWCDSTGEYLSDDCSCPGRDDRAEGDIAAYAAWRRNPNRVTADSLSDPGSPSDGPAVAPYTRPEYEPPVGSPSESEG